MHLVSSFDEAAADSASSAPRPPALPSRALLWSEPVRGALTMGALPWAVPLLTMAPRGDGHAVLVLPGLMATDLSTRPLRRFLSTKGYDVRGWGLRRNLGPTPATVAGLPRLLERTAAETGGTVSLVGWSLGGIFARELARTHPDLVRQVVTLVSPFAMTSDSRSHADRAFRRQSPGHTRFGTSREQLSRPVPVPATAVYSRTDGVVAWRDCIAPATAIHENVEVRSGHLGVGVDAAVMWLLADRLSLPEQGWRPFRAPALLRALFPEAR